jgi:hypothetical protein
LIPTREDLKQAKALILLHHLHDAERGEDGDLTPRAKARYRALARKLDDPEFLTAALKKPPGRESARRRPARLTEVGKKNARLREAREVAELRRLEEANRRLRAAARRHGLIGPLADALLDD